MNSTFRSIGLAIAWVLGWGVGGSLIDASLIQAGVYSIDGGQLGTFVTFIIWTGLWAGGGVLLYKRWIS